jgi:carboxymethylenebutenolidase
VGDATELTPKHPVDIASTLKVPILGLYGGQDTGIPLDTCGANAIASCVQQQQIEIIVYPDAPHAFFAIIAPLTREKEAKDGWQRPPGMVMQHGV